jgi:hypothetical protein
MKYKLAIYTCIVGGYDRLLPPKLMQENVRLICFTDNPDLKVRGWEIHPLAHPKTITTPHFINRYHKFFPHKVLPSVDWSVYIDGSIRLVGDITELVQRVADNKSFLGCPKHPQRETVAEEATACDVGGKFEQQDRELVLSQLTTYKDEGMPDDVIMTANYLLIRDHSASMLDGAMGLWWQQIQKFTRRDQLSLPYVIWKTGLPITLLEESHATPNLYFLKLDHHRKGLVGWVQSGLINWFISVRMRRNELWWCLLLCRFRDGLSRCLTQHSTSFRK